MGVILFVIVFCGVWCFCGDMFVGVFFFKIILLEKLFNYNEYSSKILIIFIIILYLLY